MLASNSFTSCGFLVAIWALLFSGAEEKLISSTMLRKSKPFFILTSKK
jgi:hypothetical protein